MNEDDECGRVRANGGYINHPCVLESGHGSAHEDRDGDQFFASKERPVICDVVRPNGSYPDVVCVRLPGHTGCHQDSSGGRWPGAAPAPSRTERCRAMHSPEADRRYDCSRVKGHQGEHLDDAQNTAWPPSYGYVPLLVLDAPHPTDMFSTTAPPVEAASDQDLVLVRIAVAAEAILALLTPAPVCGAESRYGQRCTRPVGHWDRHQQDLTTWPNN